MSLDKKLETSEKPFYGRISELTEIREFIKKNESNLTYFKGRRRVGKSFILKKIQKEYGKKCIYFSGSADETDPKCRKRFQEKLGEVFEQPLLESIPAMSWAKLFSLITEYIKTNKDGKICLFFDEIQWIAKQGVGFAGVLKSEWVEWEQSNRVKIIVCGSSKKFFQQKSQKKKTDEAVLRSLKNHNLPEVLPFTPKEVKDLFYPNWNYEKIIFLYMITGGIPYYLDRVKNDKPFLTAINDAMFVSSGIFLDELDEILKLEFSKGGRDTIVNVLSNIGQEGSEFHSLKTKTGLSDSTLKDTLDKLYDYEILFKKYPMNLPPKGKNNNQGIRYYMKDFFLNFYFQVLMFYESRIRLNTKNGLIFSAESLDSNSGYYINGFTGHAFELFCQYFFENVKDLDLRVYKKMNIRTLGFAVGTYWTKDTQVDLIIEDPSDRTSRIIECKWVNSTTKYHDYLDEVEDKKYLPPEGMEIQKVLILAQDPSSDFLEKAKKNKTTIISLSDFFES